MEHAQGRFSEVGSRNLGHEMQLVKALHHFGEARELYKQCVQINPDHLAGAWGLEWLKDFFAFDSLHSLEGVCLCPVPGARAVFFTSRHSPREGRPFQALAAVSCSPATPNAFPNECSKF